MRGFFARTLLFYIGISFFNASAAQQLAGNEWIDTARTYLRIPVVSDGMYRISAAALAEAGVPAATVPAGTFRMYRRGREVAIEVHAAPSGLLDSTGYLIFYGQKNDGAADSWLYAAPSAIPNVHYSLFTDTAAYFLTWDGPAGLRMDTADVVAMHHTAGYYLAETLQLYTSYYAPGPFYPPGSNFENGSALSGYDHGEGWTGQEIMPGQMHELSADLQHPTIERFDEATVTLCLTGRSPGMHRVEVWSGKGIHKKRKLGLAELFDFETKQTVFSLNAEDLTGSTQVCLTIIPVQSTGSLSVSWLKVQYPQHSTPGDTTSQQAIFPPPGYHALKISGEEQAYFDCTNPLAPRRLLPAGGNIPAGKGPIVAVRSYRPIPKSALVNFSSWDRDHTDYLIITHPLLRRLGENQDPVLAYAGYRASAAGGSYRPCIVSIEDVYNTFNAGDPGPAGIRKMVRWFQEGGKLKFVFLIGHATDPQTARKSPEASQLNMVPNAGWPGSDWLLVENGDGQPLVPVGRLNAVSPQQVWDYLQKVKAMEAQASNAEWRKNVLHLSGGRSPEELRAFREFMDTLSWNIGLSPAGAAVQHMAKQTMSYTEPAGAFDPVNRGVSLLTYFGHSGLDVTDFDIGLAGAPGAKYANHPRYPAVIVNGCAAGSIFHSDHTLSQHWIFAPGSGAVLFLAHTFNGTAHSLMRYTKCIYEVLADPLFTSEPFGVILREAMIRNQARNSDIFDQITMQQMLLHGDPAIRIFPARLPDYVPVSAQVLEKKDSISLLVQIRNDGRYRHEKGILEVRRQQTRETFRAPFTAMPITDSVRMLIPSGSRLTSIETWEITIDPDSLLAEEEETNNKIVVKTADKLHTDTGEDRIAPVLDVLIDDRRLANHDFAASMPVFSFTLTDDRTLPTDTSCLSVWLRRQCTGCEWSSIPMKTSVLTTLSDKNLNIKLSPESPLPPGTYELLADVRDGSYNFAAPYHVLFEVGEIAEIRLIEVSPNPSASWYRFVVQCSGLTHPADLHIVVTDLKGHTVASLFLKLQNGRNECFWDPGLAPAGTLLYRMDCNPKLLRVTPDAARMMTGRLLWTG
ncbi:putative type IX secretion system sortase PorU2 [Dyadobacter sandarakinus]|uniref:Gingipain domain-containing protein n=1 Tax=Dyadobacter sandarakinus TaxID=2747268 RepID=A0ABX7IA48_9BACT|nr:C25 family cysteine peptidase [Dyadobacter sandarakinus]QRR02407.1 hypothetical protein HWI92_16560 [Dyadobacter sandarakinus]